MNAQPLEKKFVEVDGLSIAYAEMGSGDPIIFQHGNPVSSYLWRNVMPIVADAGLGRCIAIDLIGMGDSAKLPGEGAGRYSFETHRTYWQGALEALGIDRDITLVIHDWGSALGFDFAATFPERVKRVCYMEAIVQPIPSWVDWPDSARNLFQVFRSDDGETAIIDNNVFVERVLPGSVIRKLTDAEMEVYRKPFLKPEDRWPTLDWPREIPIANVPANVTAIAANYAKAMASSQIPKLFINADPGAILIGLQREFCRTWPNQTELTVKGSHFIQEDSPVEIGEAIVSWIQANS